MKSVVRKIVMVLDNFPANPHNELVLLPPNTTSKPQIKNPSVIRVSNFIIVTRLLVHDYKPPKMILKILNREYELSFCCQECLVIGNAHCKCQLLP